MREILDRQLPHHKPDSRTPWAPNIPLRDLYLGLINPISFALDPFLIKSYQKSSTQRIIWTLESRILERYAHLTKSRTTQMLRETPIENRIAERGEILNDTAVTSNQMRLLVAALSYSAKIEGDIAEIGCYRGVTTSNLANATCKTVYAVDPYMEFGGSEEDYRKFLNRTSKLSNVQHIRLTSGEGAKNFQDSSFAFAFIDAVHDFSNSWFDFLTWSRKIRVGGFIAMHDVDDYAGVGLSCRLVGRLRQPFVVWGYCPNLIVFRKESS